MRSVSKICYIILAFLCLFIFSCRNDNSSNSPVEIVDILGAYNNRNEILLSSVADSIEYIQLDSSGDILKSSKLLSVIDTVLLQTDGGHINIYSRASGKFLYEVSSFGRGPDEHRVIEYFYEPENIVWAVGGTTDDRIGFSIDASRVYHYKNPKHNFEAGHEFWIPSSFPLMKNCYIGYSFNETGKNKYKLVVFDSLGIIKKSYRNYNFFEKKDIGYSFADFSQGWFYNYADTTRFFELYTDTVYTVIEENISPRYFLSMGKMAPPYYFLSISPDDGNEKQKYFEIRKMCESERYLFFTVDINYYRHLGFFDKINNKTFLCDYKEGREYYKYPTYYATKSIGFVNDLDDFIPVATGADLINITRNGEFVSYIDAIDVERWFQQNPEKAARLPERLKRFSDVKATDNIIVQVVHLKK